MFAEAENGRSSAGFIAANPLEYRAAVADDMRKYMDLRLVPRDESSVVPNLLGGLHFDIITGKGEFSEEHLYGRFSRHNAGIADQSLAMDRYRAVGDGRLCAAAAVETWLESVQQRTGHSDRARVRVASRAAG